MNHELFVRLLIGLVPVVLFLLALIYLDSYKLIALRRILLTIGLGAVVAGCSYLINVDLMHRAALDSALYSRLLAPWFEEALKALVIVWLLWTNRVGFLVDAAIYGFAVGTGFAMVENAYYILWLGDAHLGVWLVRGCGTAIMHGGCTAIFAMAGKSLSERKRLPVIIAYLPGLLMAVVIHAVFNHFFLSPIISTLIVLVALPLLIFAVFQRSERVLQNWLNVGFDADTELLEMINSGELSGSRVGVYLNSIRESFRSEVLADLICYLKIRVELSLRAKGLLMLRESGFKIELDEETRAKFKELEYLEGSIGKTGKLAMAPFLHVSGKELWELYMLGK